MSTHLATVNTTPSLRLAAEVSGVSGRRDSPVGEASTTRPTPPVVWGRWGEHLFLFNIYLFFYIYLQYNRKKKCNQKKFYLLFYQEELT